MVPMAIVVRVGLGLAYQGASSTPYHRGDHRDPSSSAPSSGRRNVGQLSTFKAAPGHNESVSLGTASSGTKLDSRTGLNSGIAGDDLYRS